MRTNVPGFQKTATAKPWYRHPWPWLLMFGPAVVVVAGIHTTWLAYSGQDALVVDDYYKQGKAINQDLRRDRVAMDLGMEMKLRYDAVQAKLVGSIHSLGQPRPGKLQIKLIHSTQPAKDVTLQAESDAQGNFSVGLPMLDIARWQVLVEGERRDWRLNATWMWPQQQKIEVSAG